MPINRLFRDGKFKPEEVERLNRAYSFTLRSLRLVDRDNDPVCDIIARKVIEIDGAGKTVWELSQNDLPGNPLQLTVGCQVLPNGNLVICNYLGHGHLGSQPQFFEITREKRVVWEFADHQNFKSINQIQLLDVKGDVTKGDILR